MAGSVLADDQAVSMRVIRRVARETGAEPVELPPLYDAVDPDALDAVVESSDAASVTFAYAGRTVSVGTDGTVSLAPDGR